MQTSATTYKHTNPTLFYGGVAVVDYYGADNDNYVAGEGFCCGDNNLKTKSIADDSPNYEKLQYYYHPDHLGSASYITNLDGEVVQHIEYVPFGEVFLEERNNTWNTPFLFNGKELDEETGLYYYGARYYNPRISLWYGVDPIATYNPVMEVEHYVDGQHNGGVFNSRNLNVYGYCYQNPVVLVDPNGKQASFDIRMRIRDTQYLKGDITAKERSEQMRAEGAGALAGLYIVVEALFTKGAMTKSILKSGAVTATFTGLVDTGVQISQVARGEKENIDLKATGNEMLNSVDVFDGATGAIKLPGQYGKAANIAFEIGKILLGGAVDVGVNGEVKTIAGEKTLVDGAIDSGAASLQFIGVKGKVSKPLKKAGEEIMYYFSDKTGKPTSQEE